MKLSRRKIARILFGAMAGPGAFRRQSFAAPSALRVDRLAGEHPCGPADSQYRSYRAEAVVTLLSIPVFSRSGVGGGFATFREAQGPDGVVITSRFGGGSYPEHAHKLNRLGFIEEVVVERAATPVEAAYFGFMTSSSEESLGEARRSLSESPDLVPYVAAEGVIVPGSYRGSKARLTFPSRLTWANRETLLREVRSGFQANAVETGLLASDPQTWPGAFLHSIAQAIRTHPTRFERRYIYNAKTYQLTLDKTMDPSSGHGFAARGLTTRPASIALFRGATRNVNSGKTTRFRMWIEEGGPTLLPIRIELQARSYLTLAFEFDPQEQSRKEPTIS